VADIVYNTKMEELLKELNLDEEITDAILHRKGLLGSLLTLVELDEKMIISILQTSYWSLI